MARTELIVFLYFIAERLDAAEYNTDYTSRSSKSSSSFLVLLTTSL